MAALSRNSASWERVLAAMEADAARAAALLISDDSSASAGIEYDGYDAPPAVSASVDETAGVPATWRLPVPTGGPAAGGASLTGGAAARAVAGYAAAAGTSAAGTTAAGTTTADPSTGDTTANAPAPAEEAPADLESFELPDPDDMPPLTTEQQERFTALRAHITELQQQLSAAMAEAETVLARPVTRRPESLPRPELVDRKL